MFVRSCRIIKCISAFIVYILYFSISNPVVVVRAGQNVVEVKDSDVMSPVFTKPVPDEPCVEGTCVF